MNLILLICSSEEYLIIASQAADEDTELMKNAGLSATLPQRVRLNRLIANASYVYALLAFSKSRSEEAVAFAKNCLRLVYRAWSGLEHQKCNKTKPTYTDHEKNHFSGLSESFSMLAVATCPMPVIMSTTHQSLKGPPFWTLIPTLYRGLALVSKIFAHQGMFLETVYYTEQAQKAVDAVGAGPWVAQNLAVGGDHWTRSRDLQKGSACLFQARDLTLQMENTRHTATLHYHLANMYRVQCSLEDEAEAYKSAHNTLRRLTPTEAIQRLRRLSTGQRELESQMAKLAVKDNHSTKQAAAKRPIRQPTKGRTRSRDKSLEKTVPKQQNLANECNTLLRLKGDILRQHALAMVFQQDLENATSMLAQAEELPKSHQGLVQQRLANAKKLLLHGLKSMSADAVFCVLSESTISFPAVANTVKGRENKAQDQSPTRVVRSPPRKIDIKQASRRGAKVKSPGTDDFVDILCQARDNILDVQATAMETCSSHTLHIISNTLTSLLMLLSASCWTKSKTVVNPYLAIYSRGLIPWPFSVTEANDELEVARIVALQRERASIQFNKRPTSQEEMLKWPRSASQSVSESMDLRMPLNYSSFQRDYVDIIPVAWKVISVSLSEARDEIHICKLQKGLNPFVLRLPLGRHNSRDADEDTFGFDHGSAEILEITELANFSAQDARNMSRSGAKSAWWAEREALDERLKALLANIENVWLSGFRGVFSSQKRHPELLSRFQHSFQNILDKYLPSRQAFGKRSKAGRVNLDSRILELFVSLGAPVDSSELEEPLTDLLYFVVDVLQFNGERNAYDEVDFDSVSATISS